ncbi:hypothetical protein GUJ93_ZPchr0012g20577 [Zizania palustris]|uniref:Uncharacterized protein n=1 Tax=Zizania palustris TaxID=103762 RepID=A0A8J5WU72_ZIZPA|nr:hypothetical protein GUJ93_ZPchr0012g20577 [Zizania palustris]
MNLSHRRHRKSAAASRASPDLLTPCPSHRSGRAAPTEQLSRHIALLGAWGDPATNGAGAQCGIGRRRHGRSARRGGEIWGGARGSNDCDLEGEKKWGG